MHCLPVEGSIPFVFGWNILADVKFLADPGAGRDEEGAGRGKVDIHPGAEG